MKNITNHNLSKNNLYYLIIITLLNCNFNNTFAQDDSSISSDRPGQARTPITLFPNEIQVQSGFYYGHFYNRLDNSFDNRYFSQNINDYYTNHAIRFGLFKDLEVNLGINYIERFQIFSGDLFTFVENGEYKYKGINNLDLGLRYQFLDEKKDFLNLTIHSSLGVYESNDFEMPDNPLYVNLIMSKKLTDNLLLNVNLSTVEQIDFERLSNSFNRKDYRSVINLSYNINNDVGVFIEEYSFFSDYRPSHNIDLGVFYLVNKNLQLDLYTGTWIFEKQLPNYTLNSFFVGAGFSYRIKN
jgi:hypothetical protein